MGESREDIAVDKHISRWLYTVSFKRIIFIHLWQLNTTTDFCTYFCSQLSCIILLALFPTQKCIFLKHTSPLLFWLTYFSMLISLRWDAWCSPVGFAHRGFTSHFLSSSLLLIRLKFLSGWWGWMGTSSHAVAAIYLHQDAFWKQWVKPLCSLQSASQCSSQLVTYWNFVMRPLHCIWTLEVLCQGSSPMCPVLMHMVCVTLVMCE